MFTNPFPHAFGLDIGDLSIKLVQLRNVSGFSSNSRYVYNTARSISLPPGLIVNGELQQPEQIRHYIQKLLHQKSATEKDVKSPWVVASLPESQGFTKLISITKSPEDLIEDDILIEAKKHIPFTEEDKYYLDWDIIPNANTHDQAIRVLISAIPKFTADSYIYLLESISLGVIALELESLAIARSMVTAQKEYTGEARALLDIGSTNSNLIVYDDNAIQFTTSLRYSGELLTTALSQKLHLTREESNILKKEHGLMYKKNKKMWSILMAETKTFAEEIRKNILFYYSHFNASNRITHITLCGSGSNLKGIDKLLSLELKIECRPGHVWKNLSTTKPIPISKEESLGYATAIGLALRAADNPFFKMKTV